MTFPAGSRPLCQAMWPNTEAVGSPLTISQELFSRCEKPHRWPCALTWENGTNALFPQGASGASLALVGCNVSRLAIAAATGEQAAQDWAVSQ